MSRGKIHDIEASYTASHHSAIHFASPISAGQQNEARLARATTLQQQHQHQHQGIKSSFGFAPTGVVDTEAVRRSIESLARNHTSGSKSNGPVNVADFEYLANRSNSHVLKKSPPAPHTANRRKSSSFTVQSHHTAAAAEELHVARHDGFHDSKHLNARSLNTIQHEKMKAKGSLISGLQSSIISLSKMPATKYHQLLERLGYLDVHSPHGLVAIDDPDRLAEAAFDARNLVAFHPIRWTSAIKEDLYNHVIAMDHADEYPLQSPPIEFIRLRTKVLPLEIFEAGGDMQLSTELDPTFYGYEMDSHLENGVDWYVNFAADQELFKYNDSEHFSSDEIMALQFPILGSIRECLWTVSKRGAFTRSWWEAFLSQPHSGNNCDPSFIFEYPEFYVPRTKGLDVGLRWREFVPMTRDTAGLPTPILLTNCPRLCKINTTVPSNPSDPASPPISIYGTVLDGRPGSYGSGIQTTSYEIVKSAVTPLPRSLRRLSNFICMTALDQLANPLNPRRGAYKIYELRCIFNTAYTAFLAAVRKSRPTGWASSQRPVTIHTGDWGCGEFGGDRVVMCFLQIVAARCTGVNRLVYHYDRTIHDGSDMKRAIAAVEQVWPSSELSCTVQHILEGLLRLGRHWRELNK